MLSDLLRIEDPVLVYLNSADQVLCSLKRCFADEFLYCLMKEFLVVLLVLQKSDHKEIKCSEILYEIVKEIVELDFLYLKAEGKICKENHKGNFLLILH